MKKKMDRRQKYRKLRPWTRFVEWARRRCKDGESKWFHFYAKKGIRCEMNAADAKFLWERDGAANLKRPSLDRINNLKNYSRENCRFIEFNDNARLAWDPGFKFLGRDREVAV